MPYAAELRFLFPRNSRAMAKKITSRGISAVFPCRGHKCAAKFPSLKSRLIGKKIPFRGTSAEFPAGKRTEPMGPWPIDQFNSNSRRLLVLKAWKRKVETTIDDRYRYLGVGLASSKGKIMHIKKYQKIKADA
jgi:hypothetical protein